MPLLGCRLGRNSRPFRDARTLLFTITLLSAWIPLSSGSSQAQPIPVLRDLKISGSNCILGISPGQIVQRLDPFEPSPIWRDWLYVYGTNEVVSVSDSVSGQDARFYRGTFDHSVFSVNAVGYVRRTLNLGTNFVANPLVASNNELNRLWGTVPSGIHVWLWSMGRGWSVATYDDMIGGWDPMSIGQTELRPGQGVMVTSPLSKPFDQFFVGEVPQGSDAIPLTTVLIPGANLVSSQAPVTYLLNFPAVEGDRIRTWDAWTQAFITSVFSGGAWDVAPRIRPGECFWLETSTGRGWQQSFTASNWGQWTGDRPVVTQGPTDQNVGLGSSVSLSVSVTGGQPMAFQWTRNGGRIANATAYRLEIASFSEADQGDYTVVVTNADGIAVSSAAKLALSPVAQIVSQPRSVTSPAGSNVSFDVSADSSTPLSYQWRKDTLALAGQTNAILQLTNVQAPNSGAYDVVVLNAGGSVISSAAVLTVLVPPKILEEPQPIMTADGGVAQFTVVATGTAPLSYQWRKDNLALAGQTNSILLLTNVQASDSGLYDAVVSNEIGSAISSKASLALVALPDVTSPEPAIVSLGGSVQFSVIARGSPPLSYQWRKDDAPLAGQTNASLLLTNVQASDAGWFDVVVSNAGGSVISLKALLTVLIPPNIVEQPQPVIASVGGSAQFSVAAMGSPHLFYQWRKDTLALAGQTNATLVLANVQALDAGRYDVVLSNDAGSVISSSARLEVIPIQPSSPLQLSISWVGGMPLLSVSGQSGSTCTIQYAATLGPNATWTALTNLALTAGAASSPDWSSTGTTGGAPARFYRAELGNRGENTEPAPTSLAGAVLDLNAPGQGYERLTFGSNGTVTSDAYTPSNATGTYTYTRGPAGDSSTVVITFPNSDNYHLTLTFADSAHGTWSGSQFFDGASHPAPSGSSFTIQNASGASHSGGAPADIAGKTVTFRGTGVGAERLTFAVNGNSVTTDALTPPANAGTYAYAVQSPTSASLSLTFPNGDQHDLLLIFVTATSGSWSGTQFFDGAAHPVPIGFTFSLDQ
jgi:hypothetical protein